MHDVLGDALKKISSAEFCDSASSPSPSDVVPEAGVLTTQGEVIMADASNVAIAADVVGTESLIVNTECVQASGEPAEPCCETVQSNGEVVPALLQQSTALSNSSSSGRNPIRFILDHRRQTAAVIILLCMAVFWFDDSTGSSAPVDSSTVASDSSEYAEADMLLDDFDAVEVHPLREPADPVEVSNVDEFPLTFPAMSDETGTAVGTAAFGYPESAADYSSGFDHDGTPGSSLNASGSPIHSPFGTASATGSRAGKFKGRIEPLN